MLACGSSSCVKGYLEGFRGVDSESFWILLAAWDSLYRFERWPEDTYISSCSSMIVDHLPKFSPFAAAMAVLTMEILASRQTYMELLIEGSHHDQSRLNLIGSQPRLFMRGRSWYETNDQSSPSRTNWNCHRIKKVSSHVIIASEASTQYSFSKGWGCKIGANKQSQILLALRSKEKFCCCMSIPPSSVNFGLLPLKMQIWVDNRVLYVSVHQKNRNISRRT